MKRAVFAAVLAFVIPGKSPGAAPLFEKVSDHCYYLPLPGSGENVAAVVTEEGILIINPPAEPDLSFAVAALKRSSAKAVRWVVFTDPRRSAGGRFFAEQGALVLASTRLRALSLRPAESDVMAAPKPGEASSYAWLTFDRQLHLFPANVEMRILALGPQARTGGDVAVIVPAEKVLFVGDLYEPARYPDIDTAAEGSALGWMDAVKQVIDSVPVLKSAMAKPDSKPEGTLEEGIAVVSARGGVSNLQNMKDLLEACQKLRRDIAKAIKAGRSCGSFLASPGADPYRGYSNLAPYAAALWEALAQEPNPK
jgi:hypothetical protein